MELFKLRRKGGAYWLGILKEEIKYYEHIEEKDNTFGCKIILMWNCTK